MYGVLWAYGQNEESIAAEHEIMRFRCGLDNPRFDLTKLAGARELADAKFRQTKALERISLLHNSKVRQPPRDYKPGEWVYVWRKSEGKLDATKNVLRQRQTFLSHWVEPGRVVVNEMLARPGSTHRVHIIWICSGLEESAHQSTQSGLPPKKRD